MGNYFYPVLDSIGSVVINSQYAHAQPSSALASRFGSRWVCVEVGFFLQFCFIGFSYVWSWEFFRISRGNRAGLWCSDCSCKFLQKCRNIMYQISCIEIAYELLKREATCSYEDLRCMRWNNYNIGTEHTYLVVGIVCLANSDIGSTSRFHVMLEKLFTIKSNLCVGEPITSLNITS